jgi:predicted transcriptional regulator of viral defense system
MKKGKDFILSLYSSKNTVFTIDEIALIMGDTSRDNLKARINYYVKKGNLLNLRKGVYAKREYNPLELASKIYTPSYISLETVLEKEGVIFQKYQTIFVVCYLTRKIEVDGHQFQYRRIKEEILINKEGVEQKNGYAIATKERAFLDTLYLYKDYYFDNVDILDKDIVSNMVDIYRSKTLKDKIGEFIQYA